ncbi:unnamed protein product, partial [Effrenium voratum]
AQEPSPFWKAVDKPHGAAEGVSDRLSVSWAMPPEAQAPCSGGLALDQLDGAVERVSDLTSGCRAMPPEAA